MRSRPTLQDEGSRAPGFRPCSGKIASRLSFNLPGDCRFSVHEAIPEHVGLGSGTQLAIAVGVALAGLYRLDLPARAVAALYQRGQRSGIGVGAFEQGGFLVDGGKDAGAEPPPIVSRLEFPGDWRVVLLLDPAVQGLHGEREMAAFQALPEFPESESAHLCRLMFTQAMPALAKQDLDKFGCAIGELQRVVGDYFAPAQGGRFSSPRVAEALAWMESQGITGIGQSSWGPTGFAIVGDEAQASSGAGFFAGARRAIALGRPRPTAVHGLQRPQSRRRGRPRSAGSCLRRREIEQTFIHGANL